MITSANYKTFTGSGHSIVATVFVAILSIMTSPVTAAAPRASGEGWAQMKTLVDPVVEGVMKNEKIVGLTVAASKNGRMVYTYGYGNAMADRRSNPVRLTAMKRSHRTPIGSCSKALFSGPILWGLVEARGLNPRDARLYGSGGILREFEATIREANNRFGVIAGMAMGRDDRTYTWYINGKFSIGQSRELGTAQALKPYSLPTGKKPHDIVGMAISNSGFVYTWYLDGSHSKGASFELGPVIKNSEGKPRKTKLPRGLDMSDIVGIAIHKDDDDVYVWYDDGTLSSGDLMDFTKNFTGRSYSTPALDNWSLDGRYKIVDMGLTTKDHTFVWFSDGTTSTGWTHDLDAHRDLAAYNLPDLEPTSNQYRDITVQDLLDHKAGFNGSGDISGSARMYDRKPENIQYKFIHRHFLQTRQLIDKPGMKVQYSNHGFGVITLLVPELSPAGLSYYQFARQHYLKPFGIGSSIRPRGQSPTSVDASLYDAIRDEDENVVDVKPRSHFDTSLSDNLNGLAAGGWASSAENILKVTNELAKLYTTNQLDRMGWGKTDTGRLQHSGKTGGGVCYMAMFPKAYVSVEGEDLSAVHVAVATNTGNVSKTQITRIANAVALAIPRSGVPANFRIDWSKPHD